MVCQRCQGFVFIFHQEKRCVNCGWVDPKHEHLYFQKRMPIQPREDNNE